MNRWSGPHHTHVICGQLKVGQDPASGGSHAQAVPVDPGQSRRQVGGVPLHRSLRPDLSAQAPLNIDQGFHGVGVVQDFSEECNIGDGQAKGVDLGEALLVWEGGHVQAELFERCVDTGRAGRSKVGWLAIFNYSECNQEIFPQLTGLFSAPARPTNLIKTNSTIWPTSTSTTLYVNRT